MRGTLLDVLHYSTIWRSLSSWPLFPHGSAKVAFLLPAARGV
jgi:hypothetical protein